ncbi:hypothetical protein DERP_003149 [Dermatophagoides pteronyssinus]|uniref:Uncharacterized protein n=1 Tax=Dermatophagoides pteronyssinus TaxID=6956 RepID=A0ABQ8JIP2_DERPT|nr:hypothetical protein DERP_003149 [Dermatophagoides pteronyssinus]
MNIQYFVINEHQINLKKKFLSWIVSREKNQGGVEQCWNLDFKYYFLEKILNFVSSDGAEKISQRNKNEKKNNLFVTAALFVLKLSD